MNLILVGLNHKVAPVEIRERLAVPAGRIAEALGTLRACDGVAEVAILSTCNRLEVYTVVSDGPDGEPWTAESVVKSAAARGAAEHATATEATPCLASPVPLVAALSAYRGLPVADFAPYLYLLAGEPAARHLCRVAAGLDSLLIGEYQILGQVKTALQAALDARSAGPCLPALFRQALRAGKRARTETEVGLGARSLGQVAASLGRQVLGDLAQRTALIIGAGKMSELAGAALAEQGLKCLLVANRSFDRAAGLAQNLGGRAVHFDALPAGLLEADLVIVATDAPHIVLHRANLAQAMAERSPQRPLVVIDLAVPRNVAPAARGLPGLHLYDMDDLSAVVAVHHPVAAPAIAAAEEIAAEETRAFMSWWRERQAVPLIRGLRAEAEAIRQAEVARTLRRLRSVTPEQEEAIRALSESLVSKLLHSPIQALKTRSGSAT
jgi:glutamyl-tRNA reductase